MKKRILAALGVSLLAVGLSFAPVSAAAAKIKTVMPDDLALNATGWYFYDDTNDIPSATEVPGKYQFVAGPETPPAGKGSLRFDNTGSERWNLATQQFAGVKLSDLQKINFFTYQPTTNTGNPQYSVYLNFDVDFDGPGGDSAYQGRLVYVPRSNGTVQQGVWQKWTALGDGSVWTWSRLAGNGNVWKDGNANADRTWQDIVAAFPNATVSGQLLFRSGEPYPEGFTGYLDKLVFQVKNKKVGYDLEPSLKPSSKDDCKNQGWKNFNDPYFDNQGQCILYVKWSQGHAGSWWHFWNNHRHDFDRWEKWSHDHGHDRDWDHSWDN